MYLILQQALYWYGKMILPL